MEYDRYKEEKNRRSNPTKTIILILIGGALIILTDLFILGGSRHIWSNNDKQALSGDISIDVTNLKQQHSLYMDEGIYIDPSMLAKRMPAPKESRDMAKSNEINAGEAITIDEILANKKAAELAQIAPALGVEKEINTGFAKEKAFADILYEVSAAPEIAPVMDELALEPAAYEYEEPKGSGMIAIIIDDMGISLRSKLVEILPAPLTLSYLPYAKNLRERTARAAKNGHELMVHIPMEPMNGKLDGGPRVLNSAQSEAEFINTLDWGLAQFEGFVGVNNHMGSRLTQDESSMLRIMNYLKNRNDNLFFIDSKTINSSIAANIAHKQGMAYNERDIFLDHEQTPEFIGKALAKLEAIANKKGYAIAIGHPHKETIAALKAWIPTLEGKGLTLVPASKLIKYPKAANDDLVAGR